MQIIRCGKIFTGTSNSGTAKACFPYVARLSNGDLLATCQVASVKNGIDSKAMLVRSSDGGNTWTQPIAVFDPMLDGKTGVLHLAYIAQIEPNKLMASILWCDHRGDASLEFFNPQTGGLLPTEACVSFSEDNGKSWSKLKRIEKGDMGNTPTPVMGPVHKLENGTLICPFETSKSYDDAGTWHHKAAYFISYDNGVTWPTYKVVAYDPECKIYFWDHRIANLGQGDLVDLFWAYDAVNNKELNVYMSQSSDYGKTWSKPAETKLVGQPWPIPVQGDTFAVVAVDRTVSQTIKLFLTNNSGKTFDASEPLVIYDNKTGDSQKKTLNEQLVEMANWSYGLPSGALLSDNTVMIAYYAGNKDAIDVNYCKVKL